MMRTAQESENLNLPPNSEFEWPDVRSLLLCPLCSAMAQIPNGTECEYWMIFYPLLQVEHQESNMTLATRTICRLVCLDCMQQLLDGLFLTVKQTEQQDVAFSLSAMEILQEAGTVSFLQDGPPRPENYAHVDDPIDAWTLYTLWESTGAWEALQNDYRSALARSMMETPSPLPKKNDFMTKDRYGRKCGNVACSKVHGKIDASDGAIIRLSVICKQCKHAYYCSNECQSAAWALHSLECESNKKVKMVHCDACKKTLPYTQMKKCSRCRLAVYCSVDCQRNDWSFHKVMCKKNEEK